MVVEIEESLIEIRKRLNELEIHVKDCDTAVIDDTFGLGRYLDKFTEKDLNRLNSAAVKFHRECVCTKKIKLIL